LILALVNGALSHAQPGAVGACSGCGGTVRAKCGTINVWHWAHEATDCDPWSEPESIWHRDWKSRAPLADQEVVMERDGAKHRADCVVLGGAVLELQSSSISADDILAREAFYGRMAWLFRCHWRERLEFTYPLNRANRHRKSWANFWWKNAARTHLSITKPLFWDLNTEVWQVSISRPKRFTGYYQVKNGICEAVEESGIWVEGTQVVGTILKRWTREAFIRDVFGRVRMPMRRAEVPNMDGLKREEISS
jgi:hypothetical protein